MNDKTINHIDSYIVVSLKRGLTPRCPFASVHRCPRYYCSLSLLGYAGSTSIGPLQDKELEKKWKESDLWLVVLEQDPGIFKSENKIYQYSNFCPEVSYDKHGYFASHLCRYVDEIDIDVAHKRLKKESAQHNDHRWYWASINPMHFSECQLYSLLQIKHGSRR